MHTLPLPEVETELNPTLNPIPSAQNVCILPQQASIRPAGPAAGDPLRKASEPAGEKLIPAPSSRPPVPAFDFGIPERQDSKPNSAPSPSNAGTPGANPDPPAANPDSKFRIPSRLFPSRGLTSQQLQFLLRVSPSALKGELEYEIPACVTVAQAILESATPKWGWGSSVLFRVANNPFGIKYSHGAGLVNSQKYGAESSGSLPSAPGLALNSQASISAESYGHFDAATWEIENGQKKIEITEFQRFPNLDEAFRGHALLLRGPRYRSAFAVRADWKQFAERLGPKTSPNDQEHCGYSTNPSYSAELIELVNSLPA